MMAHMLCYNITYTARNWKPVTRAVGPAGAGCGRDRPKPKGPVDRRSREMLAKAPALCRRHARLTSLRRKLLELLWEYPQVPLGAYAFICRLEALSRGHTPSA